MKSLKKYIHTMVVLGLAAIYIGCNKAPNIKIYSYPAPLPTGMTPGQGYPGIDVTITGSQFGTYTNAVSVFFGGIKADTIRSCTDGQIVVKVPANAISGKVTLKIWTHTVDSIGSFRVLAVPTITKTSATAAAPGDVFTISGTGFGTTSSAVQVKFNGTNASIAALKDTLITVTVPTGFTSGNVTVNVNGYTIQGPGVAYLVSVPSPVYQLDFEGNLNAAIGTDATYIQGGGMPLSYGAGISGKAVWMAGYDSQAWGDNGQAISLPQNVAQYNELTISCWAQFDPSDPHGNWGTPVIGFGATRGNNISLNCSQGYPDFINNVAASVVFENVPGFSGYNVYSTKTNKSIAGTTWHHLCITLSQKNLSENIYLDGVQIGQLTLPAAYDLTAYTQSRCYIGQAAWSNTGEPAFKGGIDKFQIFNTALNANQVYTLFYKK
ncbi:hypothetical protein DIU31_028110 [Mucilaginibacter rubeus]|uniref:IPT/TIG domain-containing protein n=1 Tax=Mucilaginibacter rubeus TaxID=2027860 RepID=A0AAE6MKT6_9SPHI|nr:MULTISPECIES: IPT/TIG domain-containing protein [Mucilaginibacter]QEM07173.1 hypothetical protein DIU31_028110 [Mucilaginibacter rubeus]QEM19629.1 hypothetical protein DIU38_027685 [Mucilaginibacter gossypii]QTE43678.1 IPT/TIG domain-containing protein [Mucilaginibacter rubeus]QTE50278.1 IPT/TIG domain-containing protein [Mucilaginibacter rubeus]QTE55365.1 IPT/TIG domain-containing protein [Mucilaginibacter rubeus]